jgi:predicted permease
VNLVAGTNVDYVHAGRISAHYLDVLGVQPAIGRNFSDAEDRPHGPKAVILSYSLWHDRFDEDRHLVGQAIRLKGDLYTVIGILPAGSTTPLNADLYTEIQPSRDGEGGGSNYEVIARLRDGATWQQADAEINRAWTDWAQRLAAESGPGARVSFHSVPLQRGQAATLRPEAVALQCAAGFILLIACANLAGLTLVRMARRTPEIATRLALGGSRWQVQKQLWVENLVLACCGGAVAVGVGYLALRGLLSLLPEHYLPLAGIPLDGRVLAFTLATALLTSVLCGMLPALVVRKVDLRSSVASRSVVGGERVGLRQVLIASEVALTVVLLAGSGLLVRTLIHLQTLPPGFNPQGVMAAKASLDDARFHDPATFRQLLTESVAAMKGIPGVDNAAVGLSLPYERVLNDQIKLADGPEIGKDAQTDMVYVTPGYFATLQMPLSAGRDFANTDGPDGQRVAIVNQSFARKFFPHENPVGHALLSGPTKVVIVGLVSDVQISSGLNPVAPLQSEETMYIPAAQLTQPGDLALLHTWFQPSWIVRKPGPTDGLAAQMQRALASVAPGLPFSGFYSMSDLMAKTLATQRVEVALLTTMAALALVLSAVGIFALVANLVAQRTREIGIRMALGATVGQVIRHIAGPGLRASAAGCGVGILLCSCSLRLMRTAVYGVGVYDWQSLVAVVATLALVTAAATALPALRAARIDPAITLRAE